jgi:putative ABC transport system ATP-binding protein
MSQAVIAVNNLNKTVPTAAGDLIILDDVNLEVEKGEAVAIVGSSGSGKTTLLGILAGLDSATSGSVRLMEAQLSDMNEEERAIARGKYTGFIFQSFQLLMSLTARENVMLPAELRGDEQAESQALELLEKVGLDSRLNHYPNQLSGGEQQRVAIARAFASRPEIMFADEPTGNLDTKTGSLVTELLFDLNRNSAQHWFWLLMMLVWLADVIGLFLSPQAESFYELEIGKPTGLERSQVWRDSSLGSRVDGRSGYGHFNKPFRRPFKAGSDLRVGDIPCRGSTDL